MLIVPIIRKQKNRTTPSQTPGQARRVALVVSELIVGGMERVVVHLARALASQDITPRVICLKHKGPLGEELEAAGVPVVALESLKGYDLRAIILLARQLRDFGPDVIHVHDRTSLAYVALANLLGGRKPVVFTAHGLLFNDAGSRPRHRLAAWSVKRLTAVSQPTAEEYVRFLGWRGDVEIVGNGVPGAQRNEADRPRLRKQFNLDPDTFVFLAVGNLKPEKGFDDLVEATALMREDLGERKFQVLIAGGGAEHEISRQMENQTLAANGQVQFLGRRSDMAALYATADAFVLSSRKEGLPMALLEAMSAGLPVVATQVGAVPQVIGDGLSGLLVPPCCPTKLAEAMTRIVEDPAMRQELGDRAAERVREEYSVEAMTRRYRSVYESCLPAGQHRGTGTEEPFRPRVLMLSPLPPLTGGMVAVAENLCRSKLQSACRLRTINMGKQTPQGRSLWQGVKAQLGLLGRVVGELLFHRPQIVHFHTCALFTFWRDILHMICARLLGVKVIWHLHDGTFLKFVSEGNPLKRAILRWALCRGAAVIVLSEGARSALRRHVPKARWHVVPNGVPLPAEAIPCRNGAMRFLFLGNLTHRKGAYDLLAATEILHGQGLEVAVELAGGEVEPGQRADLERSIAAAACGANIKLLGLIHGDDKDEALARSRCIVLPSHAEGLPMALLEGMAHGMPAIGTRVGSVPEIIEDGANGYLVDPGDVEALADRMQRLTVDRELCARMGQAARRTIENGHGLDSVAEKVFVIYREILGRRETCAKSETMAAQER